MWEKRGCAGHDGDDIERSVARIQNGLSQVQRFRIQWYLGVADRPPPSLSRVGLKAVQDSFERNCGKRASAGGGAGG